MIILGKSLFHVISLLIMKALFIVSVLLLSIAANAQFEGKNFIDQNYIEVNGKAELEVVPDEIYIKILLNEGDSKNKITVSDLENKMVQKLEEIGINISKELLIKDMTSNFKFYFLGKDQIFLSKEYQLMVTTGKMAGRVFVEMEKLGISNISIDRLDNSKIEEYRNEVKVNAIKAAKNKAELLAVAVNQSIGRAIYIQEQEMYQPMMVMSNTMMVKGSASMDREAELDIDFEKIKLEYTILCRFELK